MSLRATVRAVPTLLKVGLFEAVAYRAELLVWVLATTMPLVMLVLWSTVASEAPVGRFHEKDFTAYFLATFIVRQLISSWAGWQMNYEIRRGTLSMRLLKPVHPLWAYAVENVAAIPLRVIVSVPVALILLVAVGPSYLPRSGTMLSLWAAAMLGAWLINFLINISIGCLSFYIQSSLKIMDVYLAMFFVFSGYLIPIDLFPQGLKATLNWLPFRYQIGLPVELMTSGHDLSGALHLLGLQWMWVGILLFLSKAMWRGGLKRFAAFGG